mmetsp:Transcript_101174/g.179636  ORF Transcript_101174/g.179636 Transcript_101174/m.179636 type:complete len:86 (+) Transcript_101174:261-518(+)
MTAMKNITTNMPSATNCMSWDIQARALEELSTFEEALSRAFSGVGKDLRDTWCCTPKLRELGRLGRLASKDEFGVSSQAVAIAGY